jgi:hypothetical protein
MRDHPTGADMLPAALEAFRTEIMPVLPQALRYQAAMIARIMAIAAAQSGAGHAEEERAFLAGLLGEGSLAELETKLKLAIRAGRFDGDAGLHAFLTRAVDARLAESKP